MARIINAWNISSYHNIFEDARTVVNVNCNNIAWIDNSAVNAFANCRNLASVTGLNNQINNVDFCFYNCRNLINVNSLPNSVNHLDQTFAYCTKIQTVPEIPVKVTNLYYTFDSCENLSTTPVLPPNLIKMDSTFINCTSLTTPPEIPHSVNYMYQAFCNSGLITGANITNNNVNLTKTYYNSRQLQDGGTLPKVSTLPQTYDFCTNLTNAPVIPNSVTALPHTFQSCYALENAPTIPASVTNMTSTFAECTSIVNMPAIPNSVIDMQSTFSQCSKLSNLIAIPLSVRNMYRTFNACTNLPQSIMILSKDITNAVECFAGTDNKQKNVFLPFQYLNNTYTPTYNAFVAAGYSTVDYSRDNTRIHDMDIANVSIYPIPSDANIVFNATGYTQSGHMITVRKKSEEFPSGVLVNWNVNHWGYEPQEGSLIPERDTRIDIILQRVPFTLTVNVTPADAILTLTADGYEQVDNHISVLYETTIHYKIEKEGYFTQEGDIVLYDDMTLDADLIRTHYNVTITPLTSGSTVVITCEGAQQQGNSIIAPYLGTVTWSVSKSGYYTASGTLTEIMNDEEIRIALVSTSNVIKSSKTPGTYSSINLPNDGFYEITLIGGGGGTASTGKGGGSNSGSNDVHAAVEGS